MAPHPPGFFPPPITIPPLTPPHKQTLILLHGRGSSASKFGPPFLSTHFPPPPPPSSPSSSPPNLAASDPGPPPQPATTTTATTPTTTLQAALPNAKFVFPCAPRGRATIYKRSIINQWFDSWHMDLDPDASTSTGSDIAIDTDPVLSTSPPNHLLIHHDQKQQQQQHKRPQQTLQQRQQQRRLEAEEWRSIAGLRDTVARVHGLIRDEAALVGGPTNVFVGGISQGCAAGLVAVLLWEGEKLGGFLGMCGWLPFARAVRGALEKGLGIEIQGGGDKSEHEGESKWEDQFDPFEREGNDKDEEPTDLAARAVRMLRERLELNADSPTSRPLSFDTPVVLGHGADDEKVPIAHGREAAECLTAAGFDVSWKEYQGLGHWYSAEMLTDITSFLRSRGGCESNKKPS